MSEESIEKVLYGKGSRFHSSTVVTPKVKILENKKPSDSPLLPEDVDLSDLDLTINEHDDQDFDIEFITRAWGEDDEGYPFYRSPEQETETYREGDEEEEEEEEEEDEFYKKFPERDLESQEQREKSMFIFSYPSHFPDIINAKKSAFGSIFLKTTSRITEELALLKSITECNFTLLQSMLHAFEEMLMTQNVESDKKNLAMTYKGLIKKTVESTGLGKIMSDGNIQWDFYPITQSHLFTILVGDNIHYTRHVNRVEEKFLTGLAQTLKFPYGWPTNSIYTGHWDTLGMAGQGSYIMPHGVTYQGKLLDGMFHDTDATLTYPNKFKALHCVYDHGKLVNCQFQFPDGLLHDSENWEFCKFPDRRFYSEVRNGVKAAKIAQKTEINPPRRIPPGCYDTNDGFYNPKTLTLLSPNGELLRVPICEEDLYIKQYYRKGFPEAADFRPEYYENWFTEEQIQSVLKYQDNFRKGKITFDDLQQLYADYELLPAWSKYKRRKTESEIAQEEYAKSVPEPLLLKFPKKVKKFKGHKLNSKLKIIAEMVKGERRSAGHARSSITGGKKSKSLLRFHSRTKPKISPEGSGMINPKSSRISFKLSSEHIEPVVVRNYSLSISETSSTVSIGAKRKIPERYLKPTPIIRPPFVLPIEREKPPEEKPKCPEKEEAETTETVVSPRRVSAPAILEKYMKSLILEAVTKGLVEERERHRKRVLWAQPVPTKHIKRESKNVKCMAILRELYKSIPDKEEYTMTSEEQVMGKCDLKKLAEDKYNTLKYWGKRLFVLDFEENKPSTP